LGRHSQSGDAWYEPDVDVQKYLAASTNLYGSRTIKMPVGYEFDITLDGFEKFEVDVRSGLSERRFMVGRGQWSIGGDASYTTARN